MKRVVRKCRNHNCGRFFGAVKLIRDKNGFFKARCPFCKSLNRLSIKQSKKLLP